MSRLGLADGWGNIQRLRFNQDNSMFTVASKDGFRVFNVDPIREMAHFKVERVGSLEHVELLERSNLIALVSASVPSSGYYVSSCVGLRPKYDDKTVLIFDPFAETKEIRPPVRKFMEKTQEKEEDELNVSVAALSEKESAKSNPPTSQEAEVRVLPGKYLWEFTVPDRVLNVRLKRGRLVVVCRMQIHVFQFPGQCSHLFSLSTRDNQRGLCEISPLRSISSSDSKNSEIMIFPGYKTGSLQIVDLTTTEKAVSQAPVTINAHKSDLYCIAINQQGTMIATASTTGTLIRIWDSMARVMLVELRRGTDQALLHCISFSSDGQWLCCSSDKGTVHIFALQDYRLNKRSALATIGVPGAYAGSQWSLASFTVPQECACICSFGQEPGVVFAACLDGSFHKYHFTSDGKCNQMQYDVFTQMCEDCVWEEMRK